jgi:ferritin-like protein
MSTKTDVPGIYKEKEGVLINKDNAGLEQYRHAKKRAKRIDEIDNDLCELKSDMRELKEMIRGYFTS